MAILAELFFFHKIFSWDLAHIRPNFLNSLFFPISDSGNFPSFLKRMLNERRKTQKAIKKIVITNSCIEFKLNFYTFI